MMPIPLQKTKDWTNITLNANVVTNDHLTV